MGLFDQWPYTNFHELNLEWILRRIRDLSNVVENFVALNTIKYADPIQWNITTQYEKNTVVVDPQTGTAYLSSKPVPAGVALNNTDYWSVIFTLDVVSSNKNITLRDDGNNILSTFTSSEGDWLLWNGTLYRVSQAIALNEAYVVGYNLTRYTVEMFIRDYITDVTTTFNNIIGDLSDLATTDTSSIVNAINEVLTTLNNATGDLSDLSTTDKSNLVSAINEINTLAVALDATINNLKLYNVIDFGAVGDGVTDDTAAFTSCINAFNTTGGVLYIPTGSYVINSPLPAITKKGLITGNEATITSTLVNGTDVLFNSAANDIVFENINFIGNVGIAIRTSRQNRINHCNFVNYTYPININNSVLVVIDGCYFVNAVGAGVYITNQSVDSGDNRIINCTWDKSPSAPAYNGITLESGGGLIVSSCKFLNVAHAFNEEISVASTSVLIFTGNSCEGGTSAALRFNSPLSVAPFGKCIITNNELKGSYEDIQILDYSNAIEISGNYLEGGNISGRYSIILGNPSSPASPRNVLIANNLIRFFDGVIFTYNNVPELDVHGNSMDKYIKNVINSNHNTVSQEVYHNFIYQDIIGALAAQSDEIQFWMYPNTVCHLNVRLGDTVSDELDVIMIADSSAITVTTRGASINNKLSIHTSGLSGVVRVQPTTQTTAALTVQFDGQIKRILDVNT